MDVGPLSGAGVGLGLVSLNAATPSVFVFLELSYWFGARTSRASLLFAYLSSLELPTCRGGERERGGARERGGERERGDEHTHGGELCSDFQLVLLE